MNLISCIFFALAMVLIVESAPSIPKDVATNCSDSEDHEDFHHLIDQRQNGTENYRISLKDFVFVWAPSDVLLAAAALLDSQFLGGSLFEELSHEKPSNGTENDVIKGSNNLLVPFDIFKKP